MTDGEPSTSIDGDEDGHVVSSIDADEQPSAAVVRVAASLRGTDPTAMVPLYETVDPDALDALVAGEGTTADVRIRLTFEGCDLVVTPSEIRARLLDDLSQ